MSEAEEKNRQRGLIPYDFTEGEVLYVNVVARVLMKNLTPEAAGNVESHLPVVCVRRASEPDKAFMFQEVEILGPCDVQYTPLEPLPGTGGRGIAYMRTKGPVRAWLPKGQTEPRLESEY